MVASGNRMPLDARIGIDGMYWKTHTITMKKTAFKTLVLFFLSAAMPTQVIYAEEEQAPSENGSIAPNLDATQADEVDTGEDAEQAAELILKKQWAAQALLAEAAEPNDIVWLDVRYPKASETVKILALKTESKDSAQQGAILIIPDKQQHSDWPVLVNPLRSELPFSGWYTLSVNLPWPSLSLPPERELPAKNSEAFTLNEQTQKSMLLGSRANREDESSSSSTEATESEDDANVDINLAKEGDEAREDENPYALRALAHVQAAADHLNAKGFQNIVFIAIGESAQIALDYIQPQASNLNAKGFALIMISPKLPPNYNNKLENTFGKEFQAPILDIIGTSNLGIQNAARERKASARVAALQNYSQIKLSSPNESSLASSVSKRIKTWLDKHAPGEERKN
jgi:Protein of unknown function (DUF3530)